MIFERHQANGEAKITLMNAATLLGMILVFLGALYGMHTSLSAGIHAIHTDMRVMQEKVVNSIETNNKEHAEMKEDIKALK